MKKILWIILGCTVFAGMAFCLGGIVLTLLAAPRANQERTRNHTLEACFLVMRPMPANGEPLVEVSQQALINTLQTRAHRLREIADETGDADELRRVVGLLAPHFDRLANEVYTHQSLEGESIGGAIWRLGQLATVGPAETERNLPETLRKGASDPGIWGMDLQMLHAGIMQGRRDLANLYAQHAGAAAGKSATSVWFLESGSRLNPTSVSEDTVFVRNDSGQVLNDCVLVVVIRSHSESVEHAFYINRWNASEVRFATLSREPFRETLAAVQSISATLLCEQLSSPTVQIERPANGWESSGF